MCAHDVDVESGTKPIMTLILLLDDNAMLQMVLKEVIEFAGHNVLAVDDGKEGIAALEQADPLPDVIICDVDMPQMNGFEFLQRVRENPEWKHIFFVAMSGRKEDRRPALEKGADEYIAKPFSVIELNSVISKRNTPE
jgi:CheY-like chemotaxis protein